MRRFVLTTVLAFTAVGMFAGESSAFFRKRKKECPPVVTYAPVVYAAPAYGHVPSTGYSTHSQPYYGNAGHTTSQYGYGNSGYSMPQQYGYGNTGYVQPYSGYGNTGFGSQQYGYGNSGFGSSGSNGLLGTVSNVGNNVIGGAANLLSTPFRLLR